MSQRGAPAGWDSPGDRPSILQITVESTPRRRPPVRRAHFLVALAVLGAIAAVTAVAVLPGGGPGSAPPPSSSPPAPTPQPPSVLVNGGPPSATAPGLYPVPAWCGSVGATAVESNGTDPCTPHAGVVTVVVGRASVEQKVTLKLISSSCPHMPLPPLARGRVKPCRR
ncbi:MAG: hypothetical protein ACTHMY_02405 [Solirubrobacteraceae bacterium]